MRVTDGAVFSAGVAGDGFALEAVEFVKDMVDDSATVLGDLRSMPSEVKGVAVSLLDGINAACVRIHLACGKVDEAIEVSVLVGVADAVGVAATSHVPDSIVAVGADAKGLRIIPFLALVGGAESVEHIVIEGLGIV